MSPTLTGRCECGAVEYRVADEFLYALNCHCSNCRAHTGSAFKPLVGIEEAKLEMVRGADNLLVWGDAEDTGHIRCATCGSPLYSTVGEGRVHIPLGALRDRPSLRPTRHIFVGSKAPWFEITDDLPQCEELR